MRVIFMTMGLYLAFFAAACHQGLPVRNASRGDELRSGYVRTTPGGYRMNACVGKDPWTATQMLAFERTGWAIRIEGVASGKSLGFSLWLPGLRTDDRVGFFAGSPAELILQPPGDIWKGTSGEVHILRIDPEVLEGNFRFVAVFGGVDSVIPVTEGYFRVPLATSATSDRSDP